MCGVYGFSGKPDPGILAMIIQLADDRGGHGYGFYGVGKQEVSFKKSGRVDVSFVVSILRDMSVAIGHSRLATSGEIDLVHAQPIAFRGGAVVHNGNIPDYEKIARHFNIPVGNLDSELVAGFMERGINMHVIPDPFAILAIRDKMLYAFVNGLTLVRREYQGTTYYCSKAWEL